MKKGRKQYGKDFKAKVVVEVLKGQRTMAEISSHYQVHPSQIMKWKKKVLEAIPEIFVKGRTDNSGAEEGLVEELYKQIGQMKVELEWLKKKSGVIG